MKNLLIKYFRSTILFALLAAATVTANANTVRDTGIMNLDLISMRAMINAIPYLSCDAEYRFKMNTPGFVTEQRQLKFHNNQFLLKSSTGRILIQNYGSTFSVDSVQRMISIGTMTDVFRILMNFDLNNKTNQQYFLKSIHVTDTASLRKLVVEFTPDAPWGYYSVVYDPANYLPLKIRYTMKHLNSSGQPADHEFQLDISNYQMTPFDDSVFSNEPYFKRVDGELVLTEAYSAYKLIKNP